jgi:hypothetical protein
MITSSTVVGAVKQPWQTQPETHAFEVRVDEDKGTLALELPTGTKIALDYKQLRDMVLRLEARK